MVLAPFWSPINRTGASIGSGYLFFRQTNKIGDLIRVNEAVRPLAKKKLNNDDLKFKATWALIVTWYVDNTYKI